MRNKHSQSLYGVETLRSSHPLRRKLQRQTSAPSLHGHKLWNASFLLMDYLEQHPLPANSRVLEVGCGWGLAGIYCAKRQQASVVATDADPAVFPYLQLLADYNKVTIEQQTARFQDIDEELLANTDVLIGADICFWDEMEAVVFDLIGRALECGVSTVILTDPQRPPFNRMAEHCVEQFFADVHYRAIDQPRAISGSVLVIENA